MIDGVLELMDKCKRSLRGIKRDFNYWFPGTNIINEIVEAYGRHIKDGDIIAISEKALCVSKGNIYDEGIIKRIDPITKIASKIVNKFVWGKLLKFTFPSNGAMSVIENTPLDLVATHKKLGLRYGGLIHFLKPYSEYGIDATNLPYRYVSLPLKDAEREARKIRIEIFKKLNRKVNVLIVDTDRTFKPKNLDYIAISTRPSSIHGIIDLGGLGYIIGKVFSHKFIDYPTPVAYSGIPMKLVEILRITKFADKIMGYGFGRNIVDMLLKLGKENFDEVKWMDMNKVKHHPAVIVRIMES
ncbi:MAG: coenzyme F420-0:L-glutamate ligase [Candidatus Methanomethylicia archaeon]